MKIFTQGLKRSKNRVALLMLSLACLMGNVSWGQTPLGFLDFGTTATGTTATTGNTGFGGVRVGTGGGGFTIQNPGQSIGTNGELRGIAPTATSINSVGITSTEYGTAATAFTISYELHLSGGSSGTWYFFAGNGTSFGSAQSSGFTGSETFTGLRWVFGASNTITTNNRAAAAWSATGLTGTPFAQNTAYYVTIVGNNTASTINYGASSAYSVASGTYDLWVNGVLVGDDVAKAQLATSTTINAFRFYSESSTGNVAALAIDNVRWYGSCVLPPTHLTLVGVPATGTGGVNLSSYTSEARSGSTTGPVANSFTGAITVAKVSGPGTLSGTLSPSAVAGVATYGSTQFDAAGTYTISTSAASPIVTSATSGNIVISASGSPSLAISGTPTDHGTVCPATAATTVQYTITNSGAVSAAGVNVVSSDPQFVVSGLSSTTIAATGGTATYNVTFTPSSAGAKSSTITVTSTTSGSNSPTSSLTGTGTTAVTQAVSSAAASSLTAAGGTLNGNVTAVGVCPATTQKGFVYSVTTTNNDPLDAGTGVTTTPVAGVATGAYLLSLTSLAPSTQYSFKAYVYNGTTYTYGTVQTFTTSAALAVSGTASHGSSCPAVAASPITYTVTNSSNVSAAGINVSSNDAQFVVSALSGTTIAATGGTVTFNVTFTPAASGAQSAIISVSSTTPGIVTATYNISGTGSTPVAAAVTTAAAGSVVNTTATLNGNVTTLGVCPATTQKGFVYSQTSVNSNPLAAGTGVTTTPVAGVATGAYTLPLSSLAPNTGYSYKAYVYDGTTYTYGTVQTFTTLTVATQLAFGTAPPGTGTVGSNLTTFTVQARRADNSVDAEYTGTVSLTRNIVSGSGTLTGTTSVSAVAGVASFSAAQFDAAGTYTITAASGSLTTITSSNIVVSLTNATVILWSSAAGSAWLTTTNWTGGAVPTSTQTAQFAANPTPGTNANINGGTTSTGAIEMTNGRSIALTIGNNSGSASSGTLTLNGVVVNGTPNVILWNNSSAALTIQNTGSSGSGSNTTAVALGNTTNNVVNVSGAGNIVISSIISGSNPLTKVGTGTGVLQLTGANTYTGLTTVTEGTLQLSRSGGTTIPVTNNVTINGGTLKITTPQTIANLTMSSGSLVIDNNATLTITGTYNVTGGTISNSGSLILNGGSYSFPGTGVTINNGTANTLDSLTVSSSGTIAMSGDFTVAGGLVLTSGDLSIGTHALTINGGVTRTSGFLAGGNTSSLVIGGTAGSLFFDATGTNNSLKALTLNTGATATLGNALNITDWDGTAEGVLTVTGTATLTTGGFLTIRSTSSGTARIAAGRTTGGYISGTVSVERFLPQNSSKGWRLLSSNTSGQTINAAWQEGVIGGMLNPNPGFGTKITAGNTITTSLATAQAAGFDTLSIGTSLFKYNPATDGLDNVTATNTGNIASEQGYFLFIRGDRSPGQFGSGAPTTSTTLRSKGTLFLGDQTAVTTGAQNYALVRNPYPSRIDMRVLVKGGSLVDAFQIWDAKKGGAFGVGGFETFTKSGTDYIAAQGGGSYVQGNTYNFIESGAAFFVQSSGGSGTIQVTEAAKGTGSSNQSLRPATPTAGEARVSFKLVALNSGNPETVDGGLAFFGSDYSNAVDIVDVKKSFNFNENFGIKRDNIDLVVERRSAANVNDTLFFAMSQVRQTQYTLDIEALNFDPVLTTAFLEDSYTNTSTAIDLSTTNSYAFTVDATAGSRAAGRFRLVFRQASVVPVSIANITAAQSGSNISVEWKVTNELNTVRYEIEKSADGLTFTKKGSVSATGAATYNWMDVNAVTGYNYYRIKSVDITGQVTYTQVVRVQIGGKPSITVSPNPVLGNFVNIQFTAQAPGKYGVRLTNIGGQAVYNKEVMHNGGSASQSFVLPSAPAPGVYQLEIITPSNERHIERLIIGGR